MNIADTIIHDTTIHISWKDRLQLLFAGRFMVKVEIDCENLPGMIVGRSQYVPLRIFPSKSKGGLCEVAALNKESGNA